MIRIFSFIFLFFLLPLGVFSNAYAIETSAKQAIVIDFETGQVLFQKNAHERMPTSSMSKVMTMYVVFDAIQKGRLSLEDELLVSERAWRKGGSKMFVEVDKTVKVEDLVRGVIIQSGNDATIVLAEGLAGTEENFATILTQQAHELGMHNSNFTNASGWPDDDHYSTASDLAILARSLIRNFPEFYKYYSEEEFTYNEISQRNRNPLLYRNIGADGIKTGHTNAGGYGLIGSGVTNNGRRVIIVINGLDSSRDRAQESAKLLGWGMRSFKNQTVFKADEKIDSVEVVLGEKRLVPYGVQNDMRITIPVLTVDDVEATVEYEEPLTAPIQKGQKIGVLHLDINESERISEPVYALEDVKPLSFVPKTLKKARYLLSSFVAGDE